MCMDVVYMLWSNINHFFMGTLNIFINVGILNLSLYLRRVKLVGDLDGDTINNEFAIIHSDGTRVSSVHRIIVEHVFHVVHRDERVVNCNNLDVLEVRLRSQNETADTTESIDTDFDGHYFDARLS